MKQKRNMGKVSHKKASQSARGNWVRAVLCGVGLSCLAAGTALAAGQAEQSGPATSTAPQWKNYPAIPKAPAGAPNVLLVLTDDVGFSASSTFGGGIPTPTFDMLAKNGLRYTQLHTTAMCSPTRASLLTGRNHHAVGYGSISNVSVDEPGYTSVIPASAASLGRVLRDNGFDTAWFGKNHNTPDWEIGPMGPFNHWPNGMGFDYFYGFHGAGTDQINPPLIENRNAVRRDPADPHYFFDRDMADHALQWLQAQNGLNADKPFFLYYAPGTMHGPQQAPKEWVDRFKGKFDSGWDALRKETLARQKRMGIIPADARMAPLPPGVPTWDSLSADQKRLYARMMEIAAAQLAYMDNQFGRIVDYLRTSGQLDNTMIIFIQGDNGGALHNLHGSINAFSGFAGIQETDEDLLKQIDKLGTEDSFGNYPVGWAFATNTPYPWGKTVASQLGGLRDGMVVSWPKGIKDRGGIRSQFTHVIDVAPTIYEAVGITPPDTVDGVAQQPIDGISFTYSFDNAKAPARHREQYFEMLGSRAYYKDGWMAATAVNWQPWGPNKTDPYKATWELYNLNKDYSQTQDVAAQYPEKLAELQADFDAAAKKYRVYPLSADFFERINPKYRPSAIAPGGTHVFYPGDVRYPTPAWPGITPKWQAKARISITEQGTEGPIFNQGTRFAGYALALKDGVPEFIYNPSGRAQERKILKGTATLTPGDHEIELSFLPKGTGATLTMKVDGAVAAQEDVSRIVPIVTAEAVVGRPALDDRTGPRGCNCTIRDVTISN